MLNRFIFNAKRPRPPIYRAAGAGFLFFLAVLFSMVIFSCNQDSIFADISVEPPPVDPRVPGTPTNIVVAGPSGSKSIYVASIGSGSIHVYRSGGWSTISGPGGQIAALASDGTNLYALAGDRPNPSLYRSPNANGSWTGIGGGSSLQTIYGANGQLFAGGRDGSSWKVFYTDGTANLTEVKGVTGQLSGAVFASSKYYISTRGNGVYSASSPSATFTAVTGASGDVTGLISVSNVITAVTWDGTIITNIQSNPTTVSTGGPHYTGGISEWRQNNSSANAERLLLGVHSDSRYNKAYREVELTGGAVSSGPFVPGSGGSRTVSPNDKSKYEASIARYSVWFILQVPAVVEPSSQPTIFASTAVNGLHRQKDGLWNAQD